MPTNAIELDVAGRPVRLSNPERVYFPELGLTKRDLAEYVLSVGDGFLPALLDRPTTMERWPSGVHEGVHLVTRAGQRTSGASRDRDEAFYHKRLPKGAPDWVESATITFPSGRTAVEACPTELATIVWMVNLGTLRFHPWPVRRFDTEAVDELRLDLDPQPGTGFGEAVTAAHVLRELLTELGLTGYPKTSGGRGVHVFCPIEPVGFIDSRHAAIAIGRELARRLPDLVTVNWWKEERGERIFVDFNQMARDRTIASAYSIRPVPEARVSAPVDWDELDEVSPDDFTVVTMPDRFADGGDRWAGYYQTSPGSLAKALDLYAADERTLGQAEMPYPPEYPKMPGEPSRVQPSRARRAD